ncbi:MAG: hypothetical protein FWC43_10560 [Planctomycetaceae bacterium]|nr:hypothetical protein [Planctomycetaceae bacterium]
MKLEKVLKFKGIGHRESEIGGSFSLITYSRCPIPDALDCFELPFVYGLRIYIIVPCGTSGLVSVY